MSFLQSLHSYNEPEHFEKRVQEAQKSISTKDRKWFNGIVEAETGVSKSAVSQFFFSVKPWMAKPLSLVNACRLADFAKSDDAELWMNKITQSRSGNTLLAPFRKDTLISAGISRGDEAVKLVSEIDRKAAWDRWLDPEGIDVSSKALAGEWLSQSQIEQFPILYGPHLSNPKGVLSAYQYAIKNSDATSGLNQNVKARVIDSLVERFDKDLIGPDYKFSVKPSRDTYRSIVKRKLRSCFRLPSWKNTSGHSKISKDAAETPTDWRGTKDNFGPALRDLIDGGGRSKMRAVTDMVFKRKGKQGDASQASASDLSSDKHTDTGSKRTATTGIGRTLGTAVSKLCGTKRRFFAKLGAKDTQPLLDPETSMGNTVPDGSPKQSSRWGSRFTQKVKESKMGGFARRLFTQKSSRGPETSAASDPAQNDKRLRYNMGHYLNTQDIYGDISYSVMLNGEVPDHITPSTRKALAEVDLSELRAHVTDLSRCNPEYPSKTISQYYLNIAEGKSTCESAEQAAVETDSASKEDDSSDDDWC